jgi:hypothetical protein
MSFADTRYPKPETLSLEGALGDEVGHGYRRESFISSAEHTCEFEIG